jgi:hypothetical protein
VTAPVDTGPTVAPAAAMLTATHGQSFAASSRFAASDPFGDPITRYDLWNSGTGGGYFAVNGAALPANRDNYLSAGDLAQAIYQSESGTDTLWVRVSDGSEWSAWTQSFTVSAPIDPGAVATPASAAVVSTHNQTLAAASLFAASDPFGEPIAQYDLWDSGSGGGHFTLGGVALGANQDNVVSAAQLAQTAYVAGAGSDTLWVRAGDGGEWGAWSQSFTVAGQVHAPAVSAANVNLGPTATIAASKLFSVSDPDGSPITRYQLWDDNQAPGDSPSPDHTGYFLVNGVVQSAHHAIDVTPQQFAETSFVASTVTRGTEREWMRAYDGTSWPLDPGASAVQAPAPR